MSQKFKIKQYNMKVFLYKNDNFIQGFSNNNFRKLSLKLTTISLKIIISKDNKDNNL